MTGSSLFRILFCEYCILHWNLAFLLLSLLNFKVQLLILMLDFFYRHKASRKTRYSGKSNHNFLNEIKLLVNIYLKTEYLTKLTSKSVVVHQLLLSLNLSERIQSFIDGLFLLLKWINLIIFTMYMHIIS